MHSRMTKKIETEMNSTKFISIYQNNKHWIDWDSKIIINAQKNYENDDILLR